MRNCFSAIAAISAGLGIAAACHGASSSLTVSSVVRADLKSGRLVRRAFAPSLSKLQPRQLRELIRLDDLVKQASQRHGVDPLLVQSIIEIESNYNPFAVSPKGAQGLMQLIQATAHRFGVDNSFVPSDNIDGGVRYLKYLQNLFQDEQLVLAAYNAGEGAVAKYNRIPPYRETRDYVERVRARYVELKKTAGAGAGNASDGTPGEQQYRPLEASIDSEGRLHMRTR
jgi:soluble lytic murein transglycosylase-like protein